MKGILEMRVDTNVQNNAHKPAFGAYGKILLNKAVSNKTALNVVNAIKEEVGQGLVRPFQVGSSISPDALFVGFHRSKSGPARTIVFATGEKSTNSQNLPILRKIYGILERFGVNPKRVLSISGSPAGSITESKAYKPPYLHVGATTNDAIIDHTYVKSKKGYSYVGSVIVS